MIEFVKYSRDSKVIWDQYVQRSLNGTFLFYRDYMDYHADRFIDNSLLIYRNSKLYGLLPANRVLDTLYSHQGLTYGGFIVDSKVSALGLIDVVDALKIFLKEDGVKRVIYKPVPFIYAKTPAQDDLYALFKETDSRLIARSLSSSIYLNHRIKFTESRKSGIRKARGKGLLVCESDRFNCFWDILEDNLQNKYTVRPVHSLSEITLLKSRFPDNIKLYVVFDGDVIVGGTVLYVMVDVVRTQYISATSAGKESGALDILFDYLINDLFVNFRIWDFGQSTESGGQILNEQLLFQKEGFGGRGVVFDTYEFIV
ncbi:MAG: GNAT family N-acetyltransferase [Bacteroidales bacterium]|nr:GNAT family N-acetyltransferase [Bacteroidales bacterium]